MSVSVSLLSLLSLLSLVAVPNSRVAWPEEFSSLVAACEADPADRTAFGAAADWCDEHGEPELAAAFRWLHRRPEVEIDRVTEMAFRERYHTVTSLCLKNPPRQVGGVSSDNGLCGLVTELASALEDLKRVMQ